MRMITIASVTFLVALIGNVAYGQDRVELFVEKFRFHAFLDPPKLKKCTHILSAALVNGDPTDTWDVRRLHADNRMRNAECLDEYSTLVPVEKEKKTPSGGTENVPLQYVQEVDGHLYVRISSFAHYGQGIGEGLRRISPKRLKSISSVVVDVRCNRGGLLSDLQYTLDSYFSPAPDTEFMRLARRGDVPPIRASTMRGALADKKFTLVVDECSASIAEWFVAIMRHEWYPNTTRIVGRRTYGKAVVQYHVRDGAGNLLMKVTGGEWTIAGKKVDGIGIEPDVQMDLDQCRGIGVCVVRMVMPDRVASR